MAGRGMTADRKITHDRKISDDTCDFFTMDMYDRKTGTMMREKDKKSSAKLNTVEIKFEVEAKERTMKKIPTRQSASHNKTSAKRVSNSKPEKRGYSATRKSAFYNLVKNPRDYKNTTVSQRQKSECQGGPISLSRSATQIHKENDNTDFNDSTKYSNSPDLLYHTKRFNDILEKLRLDEYEVSEE
jgi:5-deoxy-D-glucuronate isomerase